MQSYGQDHICIIEITASIYFTRKDAWAARDHRMIYTQLHRQTSLISTPDGLICRISHKILRCFSFEATYLFGKSNIVRKSNLEQVDTNIITAHAQYRVDHITKMFVNYSYQMTANSCLWLLPVTAFTASRPVRSCMHFSILTTH